MDKKIINYVVVIVSIPVYILLLFFFRLNINENINELAYVVFLAIPCFMFLFNSFLINDRKKRKKIIILYLVIYITVLIGFVFSNARSNWITTSNIRHYAYNLIPFSSIIEMLNSSLGLKFALYNIIGNFLMLTPLAILLPLISNKFGKAKNFLITIIGLTISIELIQFITNVGAFDIDDVILNILGSFLLYILISKRKIKEKIKFIFFDLKLKYTLCNISYYLLLFMFIFFAYFYIYLIVEDINSKKIDISKMICISQEKTYVTDHENYHYYSDCNYGERLIKIGENDFKTLDKFIENSFLNDKYMKKLNISKKKIITNIVVNKNNKSSKKMINKTKDSKSYWYNIDNIIITQDGIDYNYEEYLKDKELRKEIIIELNWSTKLIYEHPNHKYAISEGKYYNILRCTIGDKFDNTSNSYTLPIDYKITENSCKELENIHEIYSETENDHLGDF